MKDFQLVLSVLTLFVTVREVFTSGLYKSQYFTSWHQCIGDGIPDPVDSDVIMAVHSTLPSCGQTCANLPACWGFTVDDGECRVYVRNNATETCQGFVQETQMKFYTQVGRLFHCSLLQ